MENKQGGESCAEVFFYQVVYLLSYRFWPSALEFDDPQEFVEVAHHSDFDFTSSGATWEVWIKKPTTTSGRLIIGKWVASFEEKWLYTSNKRYYFRLWSGNDIVWLVSTRGCETLQEWNHVAAVYDADNDEVRIYLNGDLHDSETESGRSAGNKNGKIRIGQHDRFDSTWDAFKGQIDEIRISNTARYGQESFEPPLTFTNDEYITALWKMDDENPSQLTDYSGNGHHGTINGPAYVPR